MLEAVFNIGTGLSLFLVLILGTVGRKAIKELSGRIAAFAVLCVAVGFFFLARGAAAGGLNSGQEMFLGGGAAFFVAAALVTVSLFLRARTAG